MSDNKDFCNCCICSWCFFVAIKLNLTVSVTVLPAKMLSAGSEDATVFSALNRFKHSSRFIAGRGAPI